MPLTHLPTRPMIRVAEPGDIGRALRQAGRIAHQASLSAARMRDVADVVRTIAISLVLDSCGGWIGLQDLGLLGGPGLDVVAFDRRCDHSGADARVAHDWHHLRSQVQRLGQLGAAVVSRPTPTGGTALWARITDDPDAGDPVVPTVPARPAMPALVVAPEVSGLLQAPPGEPRAGWLALAQDHRLGILVYETPTGGPPPAAVTQELLRTHPSTAPEGPVDRLSHVLEGLAEVSAAVIRIDLRSRVVHATTSGSVAVTLVADGTQALLHDRTTDGSIPTERSSRWEHSLTVAAHTAGIRPGADIALGDGADAGHVALTCAALMRDARQPTPSACVVGARIRAAGEPSLP